MVNYYRDMWKKRFHILAPLTKPSSKVTKWEWTKECQNSFEEMKKVVFKETLLAYPDFNEGFIVHTNAKHTQLSAVISQRG